MMLQTSRILVRAYNHTVCAGITAAALLALAGCGQTGTLYLPAEPAAANRATLPESLWPVMPKKKQEDKTTVPHTPAANNPASTPSSETVKP